ncbi:MAG: hypothetical protein Unbinned5350contig1001_10 [Prokaryotic dsDNA virus sp.]|nr:MAG: hypothetical protein Unbinned5350contig1001_10 [Prokaryotic dsDNA virus sp.]|tara:strand:- start:29732 stop:30424 length:693 start_codon:yes stop_codon:yes gene_type:complete
MDITKVAKLTGKSTRTIIRYIDSFNADYKKNLPNGSNAKINDVDLIRFIEAKAKAKITNVIKTALVKEDIIKPVDKLEVKKKKPLKTHEIEPVKKEVKKIDWRFWLVRLPLPMFGLIMSYGVYYFPLSLGVPVWVCVGGAMSLEMTYLGLTAMDQLGKEEKEKANSIAKMAVALSMFYNTVSIMIHVVDIRGGNLIGDLHWGLILIFAVSHSCLALLAYRVGNLILHKRK